LNLSAPQLASISASISGVVSSAVNIAEQYANAAAVLGTQRAAVTVAAQSLQLGILGIRKDLFDFSSMFAGLSKLRWELYPTNLLDAERDIDIDKYKLLMMDEGLPLAWVPRSKTIDAILRADNSARRRAVYGARWHSVVDDCEALLDRMSAAETHRYVIFAKKAAGALRDRHAEAAQSLAANTLDTVLRQFLEKPKRREVLGPKRIEPEDYPVRQFFIFSQLWGIHREFWVENGDPIPGTFNRHGAAHGVSRRQYSRLNAVLGLAHLTSLLWYVDTIYTRRR